MTAKEFVKQKHKLSFCMKHRDCYAVYDTTINKGCVTDTVLIAKGTTESNAWVNAKKRIIEQEQPVNNLQ